MGKTEKVSEEEDKRKGLQDARPQGTWRSASTHVGEVDGIAPHRGPPVLPEG